ncbi:MAG: tRNA glutamyl-Q(34) synthetase GluQRS [Humidesulfovibrio sp.]|uniref:tRNA glutamyl-Q(34) synthetase GluQRS n=1 Tax=Humidesulfovibrio sp. TaxID=2910988 RepID=UPI002733546B|nr:tRNA glutamyl-Q(34) synthetase GluQRS [Humidesulfovibrio sp.]MDP2847511.1 tRNA glutamyl-Q(34) synthetase GluQRS [Humidesulfovibrio sp.]
MPNVEAQNCSVRGRLAPSPTGLMHLGNAWSFLLAWLAARAAGGQVVLRLEDIDPERSRREFADDILRDLRWLGLDWDEGPDAPGPVGPYEQGLRLERYAAALDELTSAGRIYPCFCTRKELRQLASAPHAPQGKAAGLAGDGSPAYPGACRELSVQDCAELLRQGRRPALRLRCDDTAIGFDDLVAGQQHMTLAECGGDFAVRRSDGVFAYQLAVVLDDIAMGITQVVRGDDILTSTPRQIFLYRLLGAQPPQYAHLPLVLDHEGERLAKRHQSLTLAELREAGVPAQAITGYLAWRAGLLDSPRPCVPQDLVNGFAFASIPAAAVRLPGDIARVLRELG